MAGGTTGGATLTILMEPTEDDTYAMPADGWCIYTTLRQGRGNSQDLADAIRDAVEPSMAEQAWNGEDLTMECYRPDPSCRRHGRGRIRLHPRQLPTGQFGA